MKFTASTNRKDEYGLREQLQAFADAFWLPDHVTEDQAAAIILDTFKRKIELGDRRRHASQNAGIQCTI